MKTIIWWIVSGLMVLVLAGCSAEEALHFELDAASDDAQVIIRGRIGDSTFQVPLIDVATGSFQTIDTDHHEVHVGDSFLVSDVTDVGNAGNVTFLFITPDTTKWVHFLWDVHHEQETQLEFYESPVVSNNGSTLVIYNRNRNSTNTAGLEAYQTPTIISLGTLISDHQASSGKKAGGENRANNEWILKQDTVYIVRITNQTVNNNIIASMFLWYEHTNRSP